MHTYYTNRTDIKMYSHRLLILMKLVKSMKVRQRYFVVFWFKNYEFSQKISRDKSKIKDLIWLFDVYHADISEPYFFEMFWNFWINLTQHKYQDFKKETNCITIFIRVFKIRVVFSSVTNYIKYFLIMSLTSTDLGIWRWSPSTAKSWILPLSWSFLSPILSSRYKSVSFIGRIVSISPSL